MAAYVIGRLQVRDASWLEKYRATVPSIVARHGGVYRARGGKMETLEGNAPLPSSFVILEFPTMDEARGFYRDPEYQPFIKLRQTGSDLDMVLVEGL